MASDAVAILRRAAVPFLAGAAAAVAITRGLYATATLSVLVACWAAALIQQALRRRVPPATAISPVSASDGDGLRRMTQYLDLSPAPLVSLDTAHRLRAVNRAARRLLGAADLVAAPPPSLVAAIDATPPGRSATVRVATDGGDHMFALVTTDVEGAQVAGARAVRVAALVDIDADLKAAEAATLRDLVQVLSHEITNTLTPIASLSATAAAMLTEPDADLPAAARAVATVARRAGALQRFGEAYRELARLPAPIVARVDAAALLDDLARLFTTRWPDVALRIDRPDIAIEADADQLSQALWALLQNAAEVARTVTVSIERDAPGVTIRIADDGPGIAAADSDAIFRPFFTTKATGSGVGLALARQVFRGHGGDLLLLSDNGGATFEAHLPHPASLPSPRTTR